LLIYGIHIAKFTGVLVIASAIATRLGWVALKKICAKAIPILGLGLTAYAIGTVLIEFPDRKDNCTDEGDYKECGRFFVDVVAAALGLVMIAKGINMKKISKAGKKGVEKSAKKITESNTKKRSKNLKEVIKKLRKGKDEFFEKISKIKDDELGLIMDNRNALENVVVKGLTKGGNPLKYKPGVIKTTILRGEKVIKIKSERPSGEPFIPSAKFYIQFIEKTGRLEVKLVDRLSIYDPKFHTSNFIIDQLYYAKISPNKVKTIYLDTMVNDMTRALIKIKGEQGFWEGPMGVMTNFIMKYIGKKSKNVKMVTNPDFISDPFYYDITINLE